MSATAEEEIPGTDGGVDTRMDWWREARFGMFIHWGLYSVAGGEWQGTRGNMIASWLQNELFIPPDQYSAALLPGFTATDYDPDAWAALANRAGMKYAVLTAKHHEGFSLFDSAHSEYDVMATPANRDVMGEYLDAFRNAGLKAGLYFSVIDWYHPEYPVDGMHPLRNNPAAVAEPRDTAAYVDFMHDQVEEIVTNYGPIDIMWWDFSYGNMQGETWRADDLIDMVFQHQPQIVMNNRLFADILNSTGDFATPEQFIPPNGLPGLDWETCMTINDTWGYKPHDLNFKSSTELIRNLVDIVSKGGNYLLNVGPRPDGSIPQPLIERLEDIGDWMDVNSESIYGTIASPFASALPWGRVTRKDDGGETVTLYLHVFDWPQSQEIEVPSTGGPVFSVRTLAGDEPLDYTATSGGTTIVLPDQPAHPAATVLVMEVGRPADFTVLAHYRMGDGEPATNGGANLPYDSSGNGHHLVNAGPETPPISANGGPNDDAYYSFDGSSHYFWGTADAWSPPLDNVGVEAWVRTSNLTQANSHVFGLAANTSGIHFGFDTVDGRGWFGAVANVAFVGTHGLANYTAGEWIHLAVVRDSGTTTFYVNGEPAGTSTANPLASGGLDLHIAATTGFGTLFDGDIAEARLFFFEDDGFDPQADLLIHAGAAPTGFANWIATFPGLADSAPDADPDGDGLVNLIEYVVGGNPGAHDAKSVAPTLDMGGDSGMAVFTYRLTPLAKSDPDITVEAIYSGDLVNWSVAEHDPDGTGITISETPMNIYDVVTVSIPQTLLNDGNGFVRLRASFNNTPK